MEERIEKKIERKIKKMTRKNEQKCSQQRKKKMWKRLKKRWRENKENKKKININVEKKMKQESRGITKGGENSFIIPFHVHWNLKYNFRSILNSLRILIRNFEEYFLNITKKK